MWAVIINLLFLFDVVKGYIKNASIRWAIQNLVYSLGANKYTVN